MASQSPSTTPDRLTLAAFAGVILLGGLNAVAVRQTVLEIDPLWGAAARFLAAGLIFAALTAARRRPFPRGRSLVGAALYGAVGFAAAFGLIYPGMQHVTAGTGSVVLALSPLATYGLAALQGQERLRVHGLLGALVALAGIGIVFLDQLGASVPIGSLALVVLGMICLSESGIIAKSMPRADPFATNAVAMLTAGALLLAGSILLGETRALPDRGDTWLAFGYLAILGSVGLFGLYLFGLGRWTASAMSYTTLILPFISVTVATLLTGEALSAAMVLGGPVMLVGVYLGAFGSSRPSRSTATSMPECLPVADCPVVESTAARPRPAPVRPS